MQQPTPQQTLQYLAQIAEDFVATLRPSAAGPVAQQAKSAIELLAKALPKQAEAEALPEQE